MGHNGKVTETAPAPAPVGVTTTLVHRIQRGRFPWWRRAVVCDLADGLDDTELTEVEDIVLDIARVGFTAILVRPARSDIITDGTTLERFVTRVHNAGLKVIVRLSGSTLPGGCGGTFIDLEDGVTTLVLRTRAALKTGADGIDLGRIDDTCGSPVSPDPVRRARHAERFSQLVRILQAELADFDAQPILAAEASTTDEDAFHRHLEEEWFHHLRDDSLTTCPWDADLLRGRIRRALEERDRLGHVAAWHASGRALNGRDDAPVGGSWEVGASPDRRAAMALYELSVPGAVYVPFEHLAGRLHPTGDGRAHRTWAADQRASLEARTLGTALRLRNERAMGSGSFAFVDHLDWTHPGVEVHVCAGTMVVLNTSDTAVEVPAEHRFLVSSHVTDQVSAHPAGVPRSVPPETCAWFDTARIQPVPFEHTD